MASSPVTSGGAANPATMEGIAVIALVTPSTSTNCTPHNADTANQTRTGRRIDTSVTRLTATSSMKWQAEVVANSPARRLTARDVAVELGVSAKTVSNAYVRPDQLSAGLRKRILETAARLGYPGPDPVAAGLRRGRVGAIGVAYDNQLSYAFDDPTTSALLGGITSVAGDAGAGLLLLPGSADPEQRTAAASRAVVDGVIASSVSDDDPLLQLVIARRLPLVVIDQPGPDRLGELGAGTVPVGGDRRPGGR